MLCFEVRLNGEIVALAGVERGVLSATLSSVSKPSPDSPELDFEVGGLAQGTHLYWAHPGVRVGDRIEIVITDAEKADPPTRAHRESEEMRAQAERRYDERLKQKYDPHDVTALRPFSVRPTWATMGAAVPRRPGGA